MSHKIKVLSDIHLEYYDTYPGIYTFLPEDQKGKVDILCLCGDIGNPAHSYYQRFLAECSEYVTNKVLLIMGNHEVYGRTVDETRNIIERICNMFANIVFLDNTTYDTGDILFAGTTLWTEIKFKEAKAITNNVPDFKEIKQWGVHDNNVEFMNNKKWLRTLLRANKNRKIIILSHHPPLLQLANPKYYNSDVSSAYVNDMEWIIKQHDNIIAWFHGHTHYSTDIYINNTLILSNQYGKPTNRDPGYDAGLLL